MTINTSKLSDIFRNKIIDLSSKKILITNFIGTQQEKDFTKPANCDGFGRIRHFKNETESGWPPNPLPIVPARKALGLPNADEIQAQLFQNAACNWRCWYCYVPFDLLKADLKISSYLSAGDLLDKYFKQDSPPKMIVLSGGQPDLTPEWVPWMMKEVKTRGFEKDIYLWSDDNLSNDYFWKYLSKDDIKLVSEYPMYGRAICFKGFDPESFAFNTFATQELFDKQFIIAKKLIDLGIDVYAYATFTTLSSKNISQLIINFVDRLQEIRINLPLRVVPLKIRSFTPLDQRKINFNIDKALDNQQIAIEAWQIELNKRFTPKELGKPIIEVQFN